MKPFHFSRSISSLMLKTSLLPSLILSGCATSGNDASTLSSATTPTASQKETAIETLKKAKLPAELHAKIEQGDPISLNEIVTISKAGVSDEILIQYLRSTRFVYHLDTPTARRLYGQGLSRDVLNYLVVTHQYFPDASVNATHQPINSPSDGLSEDSLEGGSPTPSKPIRTW